MAIDFGMPPEPLDYASPVLVSRRPLVTPGVWLFLIASVFGSISSLYIGPRILFCIYGALLGVAVAFLDWALLRRLVRGRALTFLRIFLVVGVCIGVPLLSLPSDGNSGSNPSTTLIWDAATGEAWAIYSDG
jgi:hypothetical protein